MSIRIQASTRATDGPLLRARQTCARTSRRRVALVRAVDGVSLKLERGKALGIVGESGSGKTILSRSIMGLLPHEARSGREASASRAARSAACRAGRCATCGAKRWR